MYDRDKLIDRILELDGKVSKQAERIKYLEEALKESLSMMEQTLTYREMNTLTAGNIFLSCAIEKAKELLKTQ